MNKRGRPKQETAVKAGELSNELCRFTFIIEKEIANALRIKAAREGKKIKDLMKEILEPHTNPRIYNLGNINAAKLPKVSSKKQSYINKVKIQDEVDALFDQHSNGI